MSIKKIFWSVIFILILLHLFFYTFWLSLSEQKLTLLFNSKIQELSSQLGINLKAEKVRTRYYGFEIQNLQISSQSEQKQYLTLETVEGLILHPSFFLGSFPINGFFGAGSIEGRFHYLTNLFKGNLKDYQLNRNSFVRQNNLLAGNPTLDSKIEFSINENAFYTEFFLSNLTLNTETLGVLAHLLPEDLSLNLGSVQGMVNKRRNEVNINLNLNGIFQGSIDGMLSLNKVLNRSSYNVKVSGMLDSKLVQEMFFLQPYVTEDKVNVNIKGNFAHPPQIENI